MEDSIEELSKQHSDIHTDLEVWNRTHLDEVARLRNKLHEKWEDIKDKVHATGSHGKLTGPSHAAVVYLELFERRSDRFVTGTDFVSSEGEPDEYPGLKEFKDPPSGCMKDEANHRRQVTDT